MPVSALEQDQEWHPCREFSFQADDQAFTSDLTRGLKRSVELDPDASAHLHLKGEAPR
jgi:hypothetical protein